MKRKPLVGESLILWVSPHRKNPGRVESVIVDSVGKKYFTLKGWFKTRFCISDWGIEDVCNARANGPTWIFESMDELDAYKEDLQIKERFRNWLNSYPKVSIDQAKSILSIVQPDQTKP